MNEIVNTFLLMEDKFMPEMHLKQPGFTYCACGPFRKSEERMEKFIQTGNTNIIYENELDKAFNIIGLWQIKRLSKKNSIRKIFER